jgi:YbbR domain-containing protein
MNRLGLKIICVLIAVVIWLQVASSFVVEQSTHLPLRVLGLADELTIAGSVLPEDVKVRVRGSKLALMKHNYFNEFLGEVRVDLGGRVASAPFYYELTGKDVSSDLKVVSINPPVRLWLYIDDLVSQKVGVELITAGSLPEGRAFLADPIISPDSLMVTGPKRVFPENAILRTETVDLAQIESRQTISVAVAPLDDLLNIEATNVRASFPVALLEDRTLANIPVVALVDAGTPDVVISPPVVDVMVRGVADSVQALRDSRFLVTVPVGDREEGVYSLSGQVDAPPWLTVIGFDPPRLQVIVGNPVFSDSLTENREVEGTGGRTE